MRKSIKAIFKIFILFSALLSGCSNVNFNINKVDFSFEDSQKNVLLLKYYDRSNLNFETADKIMNGIWTGGNDIWGYYYINYKIETNEKNTFWGNIDYINSVLYILGLPKSIMNYDLKFYAFLFDSNGDIVEIYEKTSSFSKYKGLYYGNDIPMERTANEYKKMISETIADITANKERTNSLLKLAGTLEEEKVAEVYTKIYQIIK